MKLVVFTIVLDGMPWITKHLPILQATNLDWRWVIVHGAAMNDGSTKWCRPQEPRLSNDGTEKYLHSLRNEIHCDGGNWSIDVIEHPNWRSKDDMVNAAVSQIQEPCVLMEIDSDEIWEPWQLEKIVELFDDLKDLSSIMFPCRYFVGKDLILEGHNCYGDYDYEWLRAWRFNSSMRFKSHEPPVLNGDYGKRLGKDESRKLGLTFDHMAYATEAQVRYKEKWYGYDGLLEGWKRLQDTRGHSLGYSVYLKDYFPHVKDNAKVLKLNDRYVFDRHTGKWHINENVPCPV